MMRYLLLLLIACLQLSAHAQGENNIWYLNFPLALNFNNTLPELESMHAVGGPGEGASVCDAAGNLLFYTNGIAIFRKDHSIMPGTQHFSNGQTAMNFYHLVDSVIGVMNYFRAGIKIVQLDKTKPRYHLFYMVYPDRDTLNIITHIVANFGISFNRLPSLAYSVVDMNLNGGLGGIDPNFRNIIVDSQLTNSYDIMSDGQCGVWIVVNKKNVQNVPKNKIQDQGQLLSYLLQPDGNIVLAHSQPEYFPLHDNTYNRINSHFSNYPHLGIRFSENKQYLLMHYDANVGINYGTAYRYAKIKQFDPQTGSSTDVMDSMVIDKYSSYDTIVTRKEEHDLYLTMNNEWLYSFAMYDSIFAYPGQYLGDFPAMKANMKAINIKDLTAAYMQLPHPDSLIAFTHYTKFRMGKDGHLYFTFNIENIVKSIANNAKIFTVVARIPDPSMVLSASNFEVVDTISAVKLFDNYAGIISNYAGEEEMRSAYSGNWLTIDNMRYHPPIGSNAIIYEPSTVPKLLIDTIICEGQSYYVHAPYPQYDNHWQPTNSTSDSLLIQAPGSYTLTTTAPHCTFSAAINVSLHEEQLIIPQNDTTICIQRPLNLSATLTGLSSVQWNTGSKETSIMVQESGQYIATAHGLCGTHADTVTVIAEDCSCLHFVPNAFTPNNDGLNDKLYTYLHCSPNHYRFWVYDRWGKMVWFSDQVTEHWDGSQKGKPCDVGVYFYYMQYRDPLNQLQEHRGEVHLMR